MMIQTLRLTLRELTDGDLDFVAAMLADPVVMRYYPKCYSRAEAGDWIKRQRARYIAHGHSLWLVEAPDEGPVGQVGLVRQTVHGVAECEVGYLIHRAFWRRGYASEAARACRDHAFAALGQRRVISLIHPENLPSQGVAAKLGMRIVGRAPHDGREHLVFAVDNAPVAT
jgi:[ribosomal protein S5]-alanine N-acetyltransferase